MIEFLAPVLFAGVAVYLWLHPDDVISKIGKKVIEEETALRYEDYIKKLRLKITPEFLFGVRFLSLFLGIVIALLFYRFGYFWAVVGLVVSICCWVIPDYYLTVKVRKRQDEIAREFPGMVSMLNIFAEAADLVEALSLVRFTTRGELQKQLYIFNAEMGIYPLMTALDNFADRCDYIPVSNLVATLKYGLLSGADIGEILEKFSQRSYEERINTVKQKIKSQPTVITVVSGFMVLAFVLLFIFPMYNNIITRLNLLF